MTAILRSISYIGFVMYVLWNLFWFAGEFGLFNWRAFIISGLPFLIVFCIIPWLTAWRLSKR